MIFFPERLEPIHWRSGNIMFLLLLFICQLKKKRLIKCVCLADIFPQIIVLLGFVAQYWSTQLHGTTEDPLVGSDFANSNVKRAAGAFWHVFCFLIRVCV